MTGTNDALTAAVPRAASRRRSSPKRRRRPELRAQPLFRERLLVIAATRSPRRSCGPQDVDGDSMIAFPNGCAYRRVLQRWLGDRRLASVRVLELASYHAIVACVASGTGIALVPESVLDTVRHAEVARYPLPKVHSQVVTPLIWRALEPSRGPHGAARSGRAGRPQRSTRKGRLTFAIACCN